MTDCVVVPNLNAAANTHPAARRHHMSARGPPRPPYLLSWSSTVAERSKSVLCALLLRWWWWWRLTSAAEAWSSGLRSWSSCAFAGAILVAFVEMQGLRAR